jgi:GAF domain-containing protein/sugar diacid utilization regulator
MTATDEGLLVDELTVLDDLARRLTSLRDPREVLEEVAAQARRLLSADVAYLMLVRPDGTLRTEVVAGAYGTALQGIVLRRGLGMAGEVLRTGRPWASEDYLADTAFPHVEAVDTAASGEHLRGLLAVPLLVRGETIGVLCAATRAPRRFAGHDLDLAARLSSHAAVAIANARLLGRYQDAVRELEQTNASLRHTVASRRQHNDLRDRMNRLLLTGCRFTDLVEELRRELDGSVLVFGRRDELIDGDPTGSLAALTGGLTGAVIAEDPAAHLDREGVRGPVVVARVPSTSGYGGCLVAVPGPDERLDDLAGLLAVCATALALYVASQTSISEAELRTRGALLSALLSTDVPEETILRRAALARVDIARISAVAVFQLEGREPRAVTGLAQRLAEELDGWSAEHAGLAVALVSGATVDRTRAAVSRLAGAAPVTTIGIQEAPGGIAGVRSGFAGAQQTVTMLRALGREDECAVAAELGLYRPLFSAAGRGEIRAFVDHAVGPLVEHDARHGSELTTTLATFLAIGQNHTRAAAELHVHPNTLYRRLDRVTALLGDGWRTAPRTLEVHLALHLRELLGPTASAAPPAPAP